MDRSAPMKMRELTREGWPAFPPTWQDPVTGAQSLRDDPLAGILVAVDWDHQAPYLALTNYWRGKRLTGRLFIDNVILLPRVHALLSTVIPMHLDEIVEMDVPALDDRRSTQPPDGPAAHPATNAEPLMPSPAVPAAPADLDRDLAALIVALVAKGLLSHDDIEAARKHVRDARPSQRGIRADVDGPTRAIEATGDLGDLVASKRVPRK
jgi:hypothetical protein